MGFYTRFNRIVIGAVLGLCLFKLGWVGAQEPTVTDAVVSRALFAETLVKVLHIPMDFISEFPSFRDVPKSHRNYRAIEVLREKEILPEFSGGFFYPDRSISHLEAYRMFANAVSDVRLQPGLVASYLSGFSNAEPLTSENLSTIAKMVYLGILSKPEGFQKNLLNLNTPMVYDELIRSLQVLSKWVEEGPQLALGKEHPQIPGGYALTVTPSSAVVQEKANVGEPLYFMLTTPLMESIAGKSQEVLPMGSRLRGIVREIRDEKWVTVDFNLAETPGGEQYNLQSQLIFQFPERKGKKGKQEFGLVLPGQTFQIQTVAFPPRK